MAHISSLFKDIEPKKINPGKEDYHRFKAVINDIADSARQEGETEKAARKRVHFTVLRKGWGYKHTGLLEEFYFTSKKRDNPGAYLNWVLKNG